MKHRLDWIVGDKFTTPDTGDRIFTVVECWQNDVDANEGMLQLEFNGEIVATCRYTSRAYKFMQMQRWAKSVVNLKEAKVVIINTPDN